MCSIIIGLFAAALVSYVMFVIPFLSITQRVDADILVVEGWLSPRKLSTVVEEFQRNHYSLVLISGLEREQQANQASAQEDPPSRTLSRLEELGVPRAKLVLCSAPFARWRRTAKSARAVREKIHGLDLKPAGINAITSGTHARETWAAYRHIFGNETPVGIVSIPETYRPGYRWWTSRGGVTWVTKDFLGWLKEIVLPMRS